MEPLGAIDVFYADIGLALFDLVMLFASLWNLPGGYWNQSRSYLAYYCMMFLVLDMYVYLCLSPFSSLFFFLQGHVPFHKFYKSFAN